MMLIQTVENLTKYYEEMIPRLEKLISITKEKYDNKTAFGNPTATFDLSERLKSLNAVSSVKEAKRIIKDDAIKAIKVLNIKDKDLRFNIISIIYCITLWNPFEEGKDEGKDINIILDEISADMDMTNDEVKQMFAEVAKEFDISKSESNNNLNGNLNDPQKRS